MRRYVTEITRAEFDTACRLFTTRPTTGTGGTRTGGSTGTGNPRTTRTIGIKDENAPIFDEGVVDNDPIRIF